MEKFSIKNVLSIPIMYSLAMKAIAKDFNKVFYKPFVDIKENEVVLDIGCGPADVLDFLPNSVSYYGFDLSEAYIDKAKKKYKDRNATFKAEAVSDANLPENLKNNCDVVIAVGVLHHLNDEEVSQLYSMALLALKKGGRFITLDPCFVANQNPIAKFVAAKDRGQYVRNLEKYRELANKSLGDSIEITVTDNLLKIPYNHIITKFVKC